MGDNKNVSLPLHSSHVNTRAIMGPETFNERTVKEKCSKVLIDQLWDIQTFEDWSYMDSLLVVWAKAYMNSKT